MHLTKLPDSIAYQLRTHAAESSEEVCGFIIHDRTLGLIPIRATNIHQEPKSNFAISAKEYAIAELRGEVIAIYHSHVNDTKTFSIEDVKAARSLKISYILITKDLQIKIYDPNTIAPYEEREWSWSASNCFTLFQDYYKQELGCIIPDFYPKRDRSWLRGDVGYIENLPLCGFRQLESEEAIATHDVVMMTLGLPWANHIGVIADANTGKMLHHLADQLSSAIVYAPGNDCYKSTHSIWRLA